MKTLPRSVLVAVDFGEASAQAVAVGGFLAERCAAALHLMHAEVLDAPPYFTAEQIEALERQHHSLQKQAEQFLGQFGRRHTGVRFSAALSDRNPVDAILHESRSVDLVAMGAHGRHGLKRWWLGSVAERVLREITRPLLIVPADSSRPPASTLARMLVHAARPVVGEYTLQYARALAGCAGGEVVDARHEAIEPVLENGEATLLVAAAPESRSGAWLSSYGEPLVRSARVPILFVPEPAQGALS